MAVRNDPKVYSASVRSSMGVSADCFAYARDLGAEYRTVEFRLLQSTFPDAGLSIPSTRQATFQETFRVLGEVHDAFDRRQEDDEKFIKRKMRDAFGAGVSIDVT